MKKVLVAILFFFASFGAFYAYGAISGSDEEENSASTKKSITDRTEIIDVDPFVISIILDGRLVRTLNIAVRIVLPRSSAGELKKKMPAVRNIINRDFYAYFPKHIKESPLVVDLEPAKRKVLQSLHKELDLTSIDEVLIRYFYAR
ncbi:MAG: hypothetical protein IKD08_01205 [Alphaproteobacteria bacterium]|nr:hypothetical protein [Alphaproteobacteria bacterium]